MFWFGSQENSITSFLAQTFFFFERERPDKKKGQNKIIKALSSKEKKILFVSEICLVLTHHWTRKH